MPLITSANSDLAFDKGFPTGLVDRLVNSQYLLPKNGYTKEPRFGFSKSRLFKYMLATSPCLYADFGCELQLAVSNYRTCMLYLGELELAVKDRNTSETSSEHPILYTQNGEVDGRKST